MIGKWPASKSSSARFSARGVEIVVGRDLQEIDAVAVAEQLGEERLAEADPDAEHRQIVLIGLSLRSRHSHLRHSRHRRHSHRRRHSRHRRRHSHHYRRATTVPCLNIRGQVGSAACRPGRPSRRSRPSASESEYAEGSRSRPAAPGSPAMVQGRSSGDRSDAPVPSVRRRRASVARDTPCPGGWCAGRARQATARANTPTLPKMTRNATFGAPWPRRRPACTRPDRGSVAAPIANSQTPSLLHLREGQAGFRRRGRR